MLISALVAVRVCHQRRRRRRPEDCRGYQNRLENDPEANSDLETLPRTRNQQSPPPVPERPNLTITAPSIVSDSSRNLLSPITPLQPSLSPASSLRSSRISHSNPVQTTPSHQPNLSMPIPQPYPSPNAHPQPPPLVRTTFPQGRREIDMEESPPPPAYSAT